MAGLWLDKNAFIQRNTLYCLDSLLLNEEEIEEVMYNALKLKYKGQDNQEFLQNSGVNFMKIILFERGKYKGLETNNIRFSVRLFLRFFNCLKKVNKECS